MSIEKNSNLKLVFINGLPMRREDAYDYVNGFVKINRNAFNSIITRLPAGTERLYKGFKIAVFELTNDFSAYIYKNKIQKLPTN